jgi:nickel transport protein
MSLHLPALLLGTLCALPALAHDLWLEREGKALVLQQGHKHSSHAGNESIPYEPGFVKAALCLGTDGGTKPLPPAKASPWKGGADCAALLVSVSSGYWSKTPWETKNLPKTEVQGTLRSWLSEESVKRIDRWTAAAAQTLGDGLEIVPLANPLALKPEDKLTVRVTDNRKPVAGVPVAYGGDTRGATGGDGTIAIRIRHGGVNLISASIETPLADGKADLRIRSTTLQFDLPQ